MSRSYLPVSRDEDAAAEASRLVREELERARKAADELMRLLMARARRA